MAQLRLIVMVDHAQWRVLRFSGQQYCGMRVFSADVENQSLLLDLLRQNPRATVCFLTDVADEHYHVEVLPQVSGNAKKQLLGRRLAAWPFAQEMHAMHRIDRMQNLRREDRYLFSAIHYPPLHSWLEELQQQNIPVQGVYTQALCLPCWIPHLQPDCTHCLCVYLDGQQLRIRYLYQSRLLFSRVLTLSSTETDGSLIASEIAQTRLYLINQRWLQENQTLHLLWIGADASIQLPSPQLPSEIKQIHVTCEDTLYQLGLHPLPSGLSVMGWAAIQVIMHTRQLPNFAPAASLVSSRILWAKRTIQLAGAVMACLFMVTGWSSHQHMQYVQSRIQAVKANMQLWQAALPASEFVEADLPRLQTFSLVVQGMASSVRFPDRALEILQNTMAGANLWQLKKIEWHYASASDKAVNTGGDWPEIMSATFVRNEPWSLEADAEWRRVLHRVQSDSGVEGLIEIMSPASSGRPPQHGDTRQLMETGGQQTLHIRLRQLERTGA